LTVTFAPSGEPVIVSSARLAHAGQRILERAQVLRDPGILGGGQRLAEVLFGVQPVAERHLAAAELPGGPRRGHQIVGLLEERQRRRVSPVLAQLDPLADQRLRLRRIRRAGGASRTDHPQDHRQRGHDEPLARSPPRKALA
jgi:hypothetical protein